ncbi:MAG: DEAD/DEAH box helicase, partial [Gemmatimonadales bacterium]
MIQSVRRGVQELGLREPEQSHALLLARRLTSQDAPGGEISDPGAWIAGLEYLATRVERPDAVLGPIAERHNLTTWRVTGILGTLRETTRYREYIGEWIREGCPRYEPVEPVLAVDGSTEDEEVEEATVGSLLLSEYEAATVGEDEASVDAPQEAPPPSISVALEDPPPGPEVPTRWRAPFLPYQWQRDAARAWEVAGGRGILEVVTGAGKTALAAFLFARLLDRLEARGHEAQLIVVVPRIELVRQRGRELRRLLNLKGLRVGEYHGGNRCKAELQDVLLITQDSARRVLQRMRFDRPVFLVADECHRLGAPAASNILIRPYTWTLGLSATPERGGDLAFEEILVPRLGPVVYRYRYQDAVRDGIIARFRIVRIAVNLTQEERQEFDQRSEAVSRTLNALKARFPVLRTATGNRFWQILGALKRDNPTDERFDRLTAAANERRAIVHLAREKLAVVRVLAQHLVPPTRVLCFHERIEAADRLLEICQGAGRKAVKYHSQVQEPARSNALTQLRNGTADWLVACKSLDEGVDVPTVDTIVVVAGTRSPRQLIQRLGRALRIGDGGKTATVFLIEVAGVDDQALAADDLADLRLAAESVEEVAGPALLDWLRLGGGVV